MSIETGGRWLAVRVRPSADRRDEAAAALFEAGSGGLMEDGLDLVTHFPPGSDGGVVRRLVITADPGADLMFEETDPGDFSREWRGTVRAHRVGPLTIAPPWLVDGRDPATTIVIDPAMAFGTGEHATTRGVLALLETRIRVGDRVADLGTGSAVLAIAAAKLGASAVAAIELDPDAIGNAEANVARNGVADRVRVIEGDASILLPLVAPVRIIVANIISSVLLELLPIMAAALTTDGAAILGGMLVEERSLMCAALGAGGWTLVGEHTEEGWWSATIARA